MPYTPILNMAHILESTLYLIEHADLPHKGHPALEQVKRSLREALASIKEIEPLQAEAVAKLNPAPAPEPIPIDAKRHRSS